MARPNTLADVASRINAGVATEIAIPEFLDAFYGAPIDQRPAMLEQTPARACNAQTDALLGGICEYLAKRYRLPTVPEWAGEPCRFLPDPWFTTRSSAEGMREFLTFSSPAEFSHRNIFTEAQPLRRASEGRQPARL